MDGLDIFAIVVLIILLAVIVLGWVILAMLPGKIARKRNHPQAEAITVGGWIGALLIAPWPIMLLWAFTRPISSAVLSEQNQELRHRVTEIQKELDQIKRSAS